MPGIKPGSPAWQAGILTTILQRLGVDQHKVTLMTRGNTYYKDFLILLHWLIIVFRCCRFLPEWRVHVSRDYFFFQANGMNRRFIVPYTPQQNSIVARIVQWCVNLVCVDQRISKNRTIIERVRSMLSCQGSKSNHPRDNHEYLRYRSKDKDKRNKYS